MSAKENGAILPFVALILAVLLGMAALAVDLGTIYAARQRAQAIADAAVLAGGMSLPDTGTGSAAQAAINLVSANGCPTANFTTALPTTITHDDSTIQTVNAGTALTVQGYVDAPLAFAPLVGDSPTAQDGTANTLSVTARATVLTQPICGLPAGNGSLGSGSSAVPLGLAYDDPLIAPLLSTTANAKTPMPGVLQPVSSQVTLVLNGHDTSGKSVMAISLDPQAFIGSSNLANAFRMTTTQALTAGQTVTITSNALPTTIKTGIGARLSSSNTAFTHHYTSSVGTQSSSPYPLWFSGQSSSTAAHAQEATDDHIMILPVIKEPSGGATGPAPIVAFAVFFMESPSSSSNQTTLLGAGRLIGLTLSSDSGGVCTGAGSVTPPQLVQ